jgi:dipeptidyl-peptidase-4
MEDMSTDLLAQFVRTHRFTLGVPEQFSVVKHGAVVLFTRSRAGDDPATCLWAVELESGTTRLLASGIGTYASDAAGKQVVFTLADALWTLDIDGGPARQLPAQVPVADPRPDPAGRRIAYVCDGALRVIDEDGDRTIAAPDGPDVTFGIGEHTKTGHWWAPDGTQLLVARVDSAAVPLWQHHPDPTDPSKPPQTLRYAAAGEPNAEVTLWILGLDGSRIQAFCGDFEYVVGAGWDAHGPYAVVQSRDQRTVRFLAIDPTSGKTATIYEQRDQCWVQLVPGLPVRTASGAVVAHTDRDGTRHLTIDGIAVTPPGLQLREVMSVDGNHILFTASDDPIETRLFLYRNGIQQFDANAGLLVDKTLVLKTGGSFSASRMGNQPVAIESLAEPPVLDVRRTQLVLGSRELRAALYLPSWHQSGQLPVLLDPYGGAAYQRVTADIDWRALVAQWFAEQGFAVLVADGRGTPGRGPDWERAVHGDLFGPVLEDQVTALHEAARLYPELDLGRVGIRGWSFSGALATLAVLRRPDVFHVAVAGAGVTDQRVYNAHWRERFLGHPDEFPERYEASSLVREAPKLSRPLLLMHGLADTNVHPANTFRLSSALLAAGRPHEVLFLPGVGHRPASAQLLRHQLDFLRRHLQS